MALARVPRSLILALATVTVVFAGCINNDAGTNDQTMDDAAPAIVPAAYYTAVTTNLIEDGPTHDHSDPAQHDALANVHLLDYDNQGNITSQFGEIDVQGDWLYQCALGDGFRIFDISTRANPVQTAHYSGPGCGDLKVTGDNELVIVSGRNVFDVTDKYDPVLVYEYDQGCHMCFIHQIGDVEYLFQAQSLAGGPGDVPNRLPFQGTIHIAKIVRGETAADTTLEPVANYWADPLSYPNTHLPDANPYEASIHDMYVYDDPVDNKPIMVVAHWDMGVRFVDVSDPAAPTEFAKWDDFGGDCGDIHTVEVDFIDDKRIVAAATENGIIIDPVCSANRVSVGFVYLFDITNWDNPVTLGKWHIPGLQPTEPSPNQDRSPAELVGLYSAHNIHFVGGFVYEAMYHGGVWVIDAAQRVRDGPASPVEIASRSDHVATAGAFIQGCEGFGANVWDLWVSDGYLYASDMDCGLFTTHFIGNPLNDPSWTGDA